MITARGRFIKVILRSWDREVHAHKHIVKPVEHTANEFVEGKKGPLRWHEGLCAYGKVENLSLSGSFLIQFEFEQAELKSWLLRFAESNPAEALRLMSEAQAEAMIALAARATEEV